MNKGEIALNLTLALIENGNYCLDNTDTNESIGKCIADLYNTIYLNIAEN